MAFREAGSWEAAAGDRAEAAVQAHSRSLQPEEGSARGVLPQLGPARVSWAPRVASRWARDGMLDGVGLPGGQSLRVKVGSSRECL